MHCQGVTRFYLLTLRFNRKLNELCLPLPSQPQLVLIYRPRRDGRLSRPWCKISPAEIRTCNLPDCKYGTTTWPPAHLINPGRFKVWQGTFIAELVKLAQCCIYMVVLCW